MTWYPRRAKTASAETTQVFTEAKKAKRSVPNVVDCPVCTGTGKRQDAKTLKLRDCTICCGVGKVKNPKFKFQQA